MGIAVASAIFGFWLGFVAFLMLVLFSEGPISPRSYTDEEKARNRVNGTIAAAGAFVSFVVVGGAIWLGFRRPGDTRDQPPAD